MTSVKSHLMRPIRRRAVIGSGERGYVDLYASGLDQPGILAKLLPYSVSFGCSVISGQFAAHGRYYSASFRAVGAWENVHQLAFFASYDPLFELLQESPQAVRGGGSVSTCDVFEYTFVCDDDTCAAIPCELAAELDINITHLELVQVASPEGGFLFAVKLEVHDRGDAANEDLKVELHDLESSGHITNLQGPVDPRVAVKRPAWYSRRRSRE